MDKNELERLSDSATAGHIDSINKLINYYLDNKDFNSAFTVATRFNYLNDAKGFNTLGNFYQKGIGVESNIEKAKEYYIKAYELGECSGSYNLALLSIKEGDYLTALGYLTFGVDNNHIPSIKLLTNMYLNGDGLPKNRDVAISLLNKAISLGDKHSSIVLGRISYSNEQYEEAFKAFSFGLDDNDPESYYYVALCHAKGYGVRQDFNVAFKFYELGAFKNEPRCLYNLSLYYRNGIVVNKNEEMADKLEKQAIENGFKK